MKDTLHHQKYIDELARENQIDSNIVPTIKEWNMIEGACTVLAHSVSTTKEWQKEKVTTINLVTKELYNIKCVLSEFINDKKYKFHGIVFARALLKAISARFSKYGPTKIENGIGNLLDPALKGLHLREEKMFDSTVQALEQAALDLNLSSDTPVP